MGNDVSKTGPTSVLAVFVAEDGATLTMWPNSPPSQEPHR
jgi:hypothetical protein